MICCSGMVALFCWTISSTSQCLCCRHEHLHPGSGLFWFVTTRALPVLPGRLHFGVPRRELQAAWVRCDAHPAVLVCSRLLPLSLRAMCGGTEVASGYSSRRVPQEPVAWQVALGGTCSSRTGRPQLGGGQGPGKAGPSGQLRTPLRCGSVAVTAAHVRQTVTEASLISILGSSTHNQPKQTVCTRHCYKRSQHNRPRKAMVQGMV